MVRYRFFPEQKKRVSWKKKVRASSNSHGSVVVSTEYCQSRWLGLIPAREQSLLSSF